VAGVNDPALMNPSLPSLSSAIPYCTHAIPSPNSLVARLEVIQQPDDMRMVNRHEVIDLVGDIDIRIALRQALLADDPGVSY